MIKNPQPGLKVKHLRYDLVYEGISSKRKYHLHDAKIIKRHELVRNACVVKTEIEGIGLVEGVYINALFPIDVKLEDAITNYEQT